MGVAGTLSPAAVSPYVLAGDGSCSDASLPLALEVSLSMDGTATLDASLEKALVDLSGVAGE